jgi:hypothetical protein
MASEHRDPDGDAVDDDALRAWDDPSPLWLSHHWPDEYDRCVTLGGRRVCRRCLVLYPVSFVSALVLGLVASWPERLDRWFLWLLPLPAVVEFVAEQLVLVRHRPGRMVALTVLLGIACGRLYVRYLDDQRDDLLWQVAVTYLLVCVGAWMLRAFRGGGRSPAV